MLKFITKIHLKSFTAKPICNIQNVYNCMTSDSNTSLYTSCLGSALKTYNTDLTLLFPLPTSYPPYFPIRQSSQPIKSHHLFKLPQYHFRTLSLLFPPSHQQAHHSNEVT